MLLKVQSEKKKLDLSSQCAQFQNINDASTVSKVHITIIQGRVTHAYEALEHRPR